MQKFDRKNQETANSFELHETIWGHLSWQCENFKVRKTERGIFVYKHWNKLNSLNSTYRDAGTSACNTGKGCTLDLGCFWCKPKWHSIDPDHKTELGNTARKNLKRITGIIHTEADPVFHIFFSLIVLWDLGVHLFNPSIILLLE